MQFSMCMTVVKDYFEDQSSSSRALATVAVTERKTRSIIYILNVTCTLQISMAH